MGLSGLALNLDPAGWALEWSPISLGTLEKSESIFLVFILTNIF